MSDYENSHSDIKETLELARLYKEARQNQEMIALKEEEIREMRENQRKLEGRLLNKLAAIAGDDGQPFTNSSLLGGIFSLANRKLL
ncbi:PCRF domain-containing protein [Halomonas elongata]|uniref:hypothetical protein n=1 Tax=Halomonas elongata TaxID=2746 RepID=UPI00186B9670|nr:hypothetical protein [Halomonas elongata]MBW5800648.1 hypothetical protein [Halomonas elongata]